MAVQLLRITVDLPVYAGDMHPEDVLRSALEGFPEDAQLVHWEKRPPEAVQEWLLQQAADQAAEDD